MQNERRKRQTCSNRQLVTWQLPLFEWRKSNIQTNMDVFYWSTLFLSIRKSAFNAKKKIKLLFLFAVDGVGNLTLKIECVSLLGAEIKYLFNFHLQIVGRKWLLLISFVGRLDNSAFSKQWSKRRAIKYANEWIQWNERSFTRTSEWRVHLIFKSTMVVFQRVNIKQIMQTEKLLQKWKCALIADGHSLIHGKENSKSYANTQTNTWTKRRRKRQMGRRHRNTHTHTSFKHFIIWQIAWNVNEM